VRILVLSNFYPPDFLGGYELGCAQAVNALRQSGHEVTVCTTPSHLGLVDELGILRYFELADIYRPVALRSDCIVLNDTRARVVNFHNISVLLDIIASFHPDVIYLWNLLGLGVAGIVSVLNHLDLPWVWHLMDRGPVDMCELPAGGLEALFEESSTRNLGKGTFIALSRLLVEECRGFGINLGRRIFVLPNWVERGADPSTRITRGDGPLRCLYAGSIAEHKGIGLIVEAASILAHDRRTDFSVDLYGPGDWEAYRSIAERHKVDTYVRFYGPRDQRELDQLYLNHDVLLFPTWYREPGGFVVFEAAAAGCVPIMSQLCGAAEWLVDNVHVIKIERSAKALAEALACILDGKRDLEGLRKRGIWAVRTEFLSARIMPQIERVLQAAARTFSYNAQRWQNAKVLYNLLDRVAIQMVLS
jgi:glycosyltransferase involved in cell wall biosynthesis